MKTVLSLFVALSFTVSAAELNKSQISKKFQEVTPFKVIDVEQSPVDGFYQVVSEKGVFYASKDGKHIFSGSLHELAPGLQNHTALRQAKLHQSKISEMKDGFVTYKAPNEKNEIIVFYDTSCGYCQKLHGEIASFNALGITVHYAAFPRQGVTVPGTNELTPNFKEMASIWCADNPQMMLNMSARGGAIPEKTCSDHGVDEQYGLGEMMGVQGTPAVYSMDGRQVNPGYAPAKVIAERLNQMGL